MGRARVKIGALAASFTLLAACDPVHDGAVADLGPEAAGVRPGPAHRPGQPCLVCHGGSGPGPQFSVGGTVVDSPDDPSAVGGVIVHLTDAKGATVTLRTNRVGNFYETQRGWAPTYPVRVELRNVQAVPVTMRTHVGRDGSCAGCHKAAPGPDSPGPIYVNPPDAGAPTR